LMPIDVQPVDHGEIIFVCVTMMVGMVLNASIISALASAMSSIDAIAQHHKSKLTRIEAFLRHNSIPSELHTRLVSYYRYIFLNSQSSDNLSDFNDLPPQLSMRLAIVLNRELIKRSPIFHALDNRSILLVLRRLTSLTLSPETVALRQGQPNFSMYFVARGLLFVLRDEEVVGTLVDHDCFGEETMMTDQVPDHSVITKSFVTVMALSREDFYAACPDLLENTALQGAAKARKWDKARKRLSHDEGHGNGAPSQPKAPQGWNRILNCRGSSRNMVLGGAPSASPSKPKMTLKMARSNRQLQSAPAAISEADADALRQQLDADADAAPPPNEADVAFPPTADPPAASVTSGWLDA